MQKNNSDDTIFNKIDELISELIKTRKKNLLIIYYASNKMPIGRMLIDDVNLLYEEFITSQINPEENKIDLDVVIHTLGGDPSAAYLMGQQIRFFSNEINMLIPTFAYSAGTLLTFCADKILLANNARLSPIDISFVSLVLRALIPLIPNSFAKILETLN